MKLEIEELDLTDAFIIKPQESHDERGSFVKLYTKELLEKKKIIPMFFEEFLTKSKKGVIRGLHYQSGEYSQAKLIRCVEGKIFDVILDLRTSSPTFGKWTSVILSDENLISLFVPRGFAHGFIVRSKNASVLYSCDNAYAANYERGIIWNDPKLKIPWGMAMPILSERDRNWPQFKDAEYFE